MANAADNGNGNGKNAGNGNGRRNGNGKLIRYIVLIGLCVVFGATASAMTNEVFGAQDTLGVLPFIVHALAIVASIYLLGKGADWFVTASVRIANRFGIPHIIIGLTVVAFGTSAPEFAVTLMAAMNGHGDISIGNVVGSNIFNLGFILGGVALISAVGIPVARKVVLRDGTFLIFATLVLFVFLGGLRFMAAFELPQAVEHEQPYLRFVTQPSPSTVDGTVPSFRIEARNKDKTTVLDRDVAITVTVLQLPAEGGDATESEPIAIDAAKVIGTRTITTNEGLANFADLQVTTPGTGYLLRVSADGFTPATSSQFRVYEEWPAIEPFNFRLDILEGVLMLAGLVVYMSILLLVRGKRKTGVEAIKEAETLHVPIEEIEGGGSVIDEDLTEDKATIWDLGIWAFALGMVLGGGHILVDSSVWYAETFGVPEWVIAVTIVAAGTSAPEFAVSLIAALRRRFDISAGNLIGSDLFNILGVLGVAGIVNANGIGISEHSLGSLLMLNVMVLVAVFLMFTGRRVKRWEGAILVLIALGRWAWDFYLVVATNAL